MARENWFNTASILVGNMVLAAIFLLSAVPGWPQDSSAEELAEGTEKETIVIRADQAWEEPDTEEVLHFKGSFELISPEWELRSDEADLYGPLDDPNRIVARGDPAVVKILNDDETVVGEGLTIVYERDTDILTLTETAHIMGETVSMKSAEIVYDLGAERLISSGTSGVEMVLERDKR